MIKILFVCHGNICRSPMAEFVLKDMVSREGLEQEFYIASAATSSEELGNPVHHGTRRKLQEAGISSEGKKAIKLVASDSGKYDYYIGMDSANIRNMKRILQSDDRILRLLDFTGEPADIADPWYTGDFDAAFRDVQKGCAALLKKLCSGK